MYSRIILLLVATTSVSLGSPLGGRVVNGTDARVGEFPSEASLRLLDSHNCGATILDQMHVLTACHCVTGYSASLLSVQYGLVDISSGANAPNVVKVDSTITHPDYDPNNGYLNDIAIVKLAEPLTFVPTVQPTILPPALNATPENSPCVLSGWGYSQTDNPQVMTHLQKVDLTVYSDDACEEAHRLTGPTNREYHICAGVPEGGKGQCNGDSGSPLMVDGIQVGIVSWSVKPCTVKGYPGVFTKVSRHVSWIQEQLAKDPK